MDMKTKIIITAMLLTTAYVLLVNLMFLSGFGKDEMVKVGWYSEFGGNSTTTLYPLYVWLNFPYTVCFYFFTTLFFAKVKVHVNKWLGETAFVLWCVSLVPILVNTVYDLYMMECMVARLYVRVSSVTLLSRPLRIARALMVVVRFIMNGSVYRSDSLVGSEPSSV